MRKRFAYAFFGRHDRREGRRRRGRWADLNRRLEAGSHAGGALRHLRVGAGLVGVDPGQTALRSPSNGGSRRRTAGFMVESMSSGFRAPTGRSPP